MTFKKLLHSRSVSSLDVKLAASLSKAAGGELGKLIAWMIETNQT